MAQRNYYSRDGNGQFDRILGYDALNSYGTFLGYIINNMNNSICGKIRRHFLILELEKVSFID